MKPKNFDEFIATHEPVDDNLGEQVIPWRTKDFAEGYKARINGKPLDWMSSKEWEKGWYYANALLQMID